VEADFCNRVLHAPPEVTECKNWAFARHHRDKFSDETSILPAKAALSETEWSKVTAHIRGSLVSAIMLAVLAAVIVGFGVEASAQPVVSAVPVSWLFCGELPVSASDASGREASELANDVCNFLSGWTPWDEDGEDD
jgi:hypothetical protein